jgi:DNA processing protein
MLPEIDNEELFYQLALTFVNGIGHKTGRLLIDHFVNAKNVFNAPVKELAHIDGITPIKAKGFKEPEVMKRAEEELEYISKNNIKALFFNDERYPQRMNNCADAPLLLYYKGNANLNAEKVVAIVGTRKSTEYGHKLTDDLVDGLQTQENILIVSGLADGIDAIAHKRAVHAGLPTVGVLGHGLDRIYPPNNKKLANEMLENGGLLTEFTNGTELERGFFPMRNRVVAGISDVTIVVESDIKGGALITARMASGYNREVAAFPGRTTDSKSSGCNELIRTNVAAMITNADDLLELMNWSEGKKQKAVQKQLFLNLSADEQKIVDLLQSKDSVHADELYHHTGLGNSQLAATLLQLEMQGIIKTLPGKNYRIA